MLRSVESELPTTRGLAPDTVIRVETMAGLFRVISVESEDVVYLPAFEIRAGDLEELMEKGGEL